MKPKGHGLEETRPDHAVGSGRIMLLVAAGSCC